MSLRNPLPLPGDSVAAGEYFPDRGNWPSNAVNLTGSNWLNVVFFTAARTESINNISVITGTTAAAATPTLCRFGVYTVDTAGKMTALVASTPNDTTLFAAANTAYTKGFSATFNKVAGQRYGVAILVISAAATPTFVGRVTASATAAQMQPTLDLPQLQCRMSPGNTGSDLGASYLYSINVSSAQSVGTMLLP